MVLTADQEMIVNQGQMVQIVKMTEMQQVKQVVVNAIAQEGGVDYTATQVSPARRAHMTSHVSTMALCTERRRLGANAVVWPDTGV